MKPSTILVTGAAGFIGSHLTDRLLSLGHRVVGLDNFCDFYDPAIKRRNIAPASSHGSFSLAEGDLRDRDMVMATFAEHRPNAIVHLAAMAGVRPSIENPSLYSQVNIDGTVNMLDAAVKHTQPSEAKFIFASSSSVYGNNKTVPFSEADAVDHPISPYAATKKAGELLCHTYHHLYQLPITALRFFTVFGPRQRPDLAIAKFLRLISNNETIPMFGDGSTSRDYTFVEDIVDGILAAIDHCTGYHLYNLGGSSPVSLKEMIATIEDVLGKQANIEQKPMQPGDVNRTFADLARVTAEIGYAPKTSLRDGIAKQWAWMQQQAANAAA